MKRILMMIRNNLLIVPYFYLQLIIYGNSKNKTKKEKFDLIQNITKKANKGGKVTILVKGITNIPKEEGYILFPNHQGLYDVLAIAAVHPHPFSVVVKKELEKILLLKRIFKCIGVLSIDREDVRKSVKIIKQVTEEVIEGHNYLIFAEGTRSKHMNIVGDFKGGSFKAAINAKCPIVPVMLYDAFKPFDTNSVAPVSVYISYLDPLYYEEYKDLKSVEIGKIVKSRIEAAIEEIQKSL